MFRPIRTPLLLPPSPFLSLSLFFCACTFLLSVSGAETKFGNSYDRSSQYEINRWVMLAYFYNNSCLWHPVMLASLPIWDIKTAGATGSTYYSSLSFSLYFSPWLLISFFATPSFTSIIRCSLPASLNPCFFFLIFLPFLFRDISRSFQFYSFILVLDRFDRKFSLTVFCFPSFIFFNLYSLFIFPSYQLFPPLSFILFLLFQSFLPSLFSFLTIFFRDLSIYLNLRHSCF